MPLAHTHHPVLGAVVRARDLVQQLQEVVDVEQHHAREQDHGNGADDDVRNGEAAKEHDLSRNANVLSAIAPPRLHALTPWR